MKSVWRVGIVLMLQSIAFAQPGPRPERLSPAYNHDRWETRPRDIVRDFRAFTASFDGEDDNDGDGGGDIWGIPEWVSYEVHVGNERTEYESRPSPWMTIPELYEAGIAPRDQSYVRSGYERGHLCTRELARRLGQNADWNSHNVLNAVPQPPEFNKGHWRGLEKWTAIWANTYGKIWVICGPVVLNRVGNARPSEWIGEGDELPVAVPQKCFKIVVKESGRPDRPDVLAFIYDNDPELNQSALSVDHTGYLFSVRDVEEATGLDFFTGLSQRDQDAIETDAATELWPGPDGYDRDSFVRAFGISPHAPFAPRAPNKGMRMMAQIDAIYDAADKTEIVEAAESTNTSSCMTKSYMRTCLFWRLFRRCR